ncbi:hypothetical protein [Acinetobacter modestus]|uniref:hypothetical protein n=1 Tax=Acinetobacter modestus TaxID=1776740 RepID=UPI00320B54F3
MNIKANVVKSVGVLAEREFIAESIKRQNNKRYTSFKVVCFQAICLVLVLAVILSAICLAAHSYFWEQNRQQIETEALLKQLEKGEVIEMTARVGGQHE